MDSWTLQGDSYSFLRSPPRTFSLCHRDGTPNRVELIDIINVPTQRTAISETTCLCDIFGDDCDPTSLSSSTAVGSFVPSQREVGESTATSPPLDDLNDSSSSYHTAPGSSGGEEGFDDPTERIQSPLLQSEFSQRKKSEGKEVSTDLPELSKDRRSPLESKSCSSVPVRSEGNPSPEVVKTICGERIPSPSQNNLSPERTVSSSTSSSVETRYSPSLFNQRQAHSEAEPRRITPTVKDRQNSPVHQPLTQPQSPQTVNGVSSSSSDSANAQSSREFSVVGVSPEPKSSYLNQNNNPSPGPAFKDFPLDLIETAFKSRTNPSSPLPSASCTELSSESRESQISSELKNSSCSSSPFPELRGRVSLPDLFSRGSTPDIEDCPHNCELISIPDTAERNSATTPEHQDKRLSAGAGSNSLTPSPRYTPPSPVISITPSPELLLNIVPPESKHTATSPDLLSAAALAKCGARTPSPCPSPKIRQSSTPSDTSTGVSSPAVDFSLSPSPEVQSCSPTESRYTAPSPEIRIIASSPELSRREQSSEVEATSDSPLLDPQIEFDPSRSFTSSPHITGISYSVVQPEDRDTIRFPELYRFATPESERSHSSPEARSPAPSRGSKQSSKASSPVTPPGSPHVSAYTSSVQPPEITLPHQSRYQTPSPQPKHHTVSPEPRYQAASSDKDRSPSPLHVSRDASPSVPSPGQRSPQHSPSTLYTEDNPHYSQPTPTTKSIKGVSPSLDITEIQYHTQWETDSVSPSLEVDEERKSVAAEIKSSSSEVATQSPVSPSPFLSQENIDIPLTKQSTDDEVTPIVIDIQHNSGEASLSEEKQETGPTFCHVEEPDSSPPTENKFISPSQIFSSKDRGQHISPVHKAAAKKSKQQPQLTHYSLTSESSGSSKSNSLSETSSRQLLTKVVSENRAGFSEDMAHHVNRRRTPSPPITRFTPVHIIAPEKPHRQWQNRGHLQGEASSQSAHLKKVVTSRESPNVVPVDNNSQPQWVRLGKQLEMERKMQLEEERELGRHWDREMERGKKREGWELEKGEEWQGDASYRGEQVELSFNARNRKASLSRSTAPTSRETRKGLPTVHSYSETLPAARQLQQQQSLLRLSSQQDTKGLGPSRRLQLPATQNKNSPRLVANRPSRSSSSSMGSEFDEADNEVKWFTDLAFSSLSSPEVDYLDMYNSSHPSSTNISQTSTQESPAGVNAAWLAYADLRGSAPKPDDDLSFQQPPAHYGEGLDPSRCYEMGSFECIDVAVEREDSRKVRRGVPKRQIQLKRKDSAEGNQSSENSSPGVPVMVNSPSLERHSREALLRQHSTPAGSQEPLEDISEPIQQNERKLKKSVSLDETFTKTKLATCLIKSILSKKMQSVDKLPGEEVGSEGRQTLEENSPAAESAVMPFRKSPKSVADNLSSPLHSDYSLSSDGLAMSREKNTKDDKAPSKSFGAESSNMPSSNSSNKSINFSQTENKEPDSQKRIYNTTSIRSEMRSELKVPKDYKQSPAGVQPTDDSKTWEKSTGGDSAKVTAGKTGSPSGVRITEDHKQLQQEDTSSHPSKTQEITLKGVVKKKASLNVCLTPEAENKLEASSPDLSFREKEGREEPDVDLKTEEEDRNADNKVKFPIHKVRDVRRLVKNTYNLSFKATSSIMPADVSDEKIGSCDEERMEEIKVQRGKQITEEVEREVRREETLEKRKEEKKMKMKDEELQTFSPPLQSKGKPLSHLHPIQIQYKAVCLNEGKNKTTPSSKDSENPAVKQKPSPKLVTEEDREQKNFSNLQTYKTGDAAATKPGQHDKKKEPETQETTTDAYKVQDGEEKHTVGRTDRKPPMLGSLPKLPSKDREVSTAVVLIRDGSNKTKTCPAKEEGTAPPQAPAASPSPELTTRVDPPGGHSVSMLLKEKGYQADIGAVVGDRQTAPTGKGVPRKHVNSLEIPLQTTMPSDGRIAAHRERTFSSSSTMSSRSAVSDNTDTKTTEEEGVCVMPAVRNTAKQNTATSQGNMQDRVAHFNEDKEQGDFEAVKRQDPTFPRSPALRRFRPQPIEVKSLSKEMQKQETPTNSIGSNRPQAIEVKSIATISEKPAVPPKPSCKFKPAELRAKVPNEAPRSAATSSTGKPQGDERSQTIVVSSPTIYRKISNESNATSNYTRKLAVSAVSSLKPPPSKITATTISSLSNQTTAASNKEVPNDGGLLHHSGAPPQSSKQTQRPTNIATTSVSATGPSIASAAGRVSDPTANQVAGSLSAEDRQTSQPVAVDPNTQLQNPRTAYSHEQVMPVTSNSARQPSAAHATQAPGYTHQQCRRSVSNENPQRTDDLLFYASDDPPSYDERESFSPLIPPDLTQRRSSYQPSSRPPPCSCTVGCPPHPGLPPPHHHRSPHNLTPPVPPHSPGQALPYAVTQPPLRPHQCRADPQPMMFHPSSSPKSNTFVQSQTPAMYQPLHQPPPCPPHPSLMHACPAERPIQPIDPRRPPVHRSPQQQPPGLAGVPYSDSGHSHSPGLPPMDPQYMCGPQSLGQSYGSDYGGDSSSLYSESTYGQTPRRVLLDPETGKYFYIEVPMQPLRKMLFDPETGQYVEVLIPQQAMSHSGLYPPSAAPYPTLHNPNMYASAPQYMPYAAPPPPAHSQTQPQPPRYPESSVAATMQPNGPIVSYRNSSGQGPKPEPQNHPPLDQNYLESMYYVPTGINASPNPTPPVYYHKHPPNLPPTGGKRS